MKGKRTNLSRAKGMAQVHNELVDRIVSNVPAVKPVASVFGQWILWLALSAVIMGLWLLDLHIQNNAGQVLPHMPPLAFLLTAYLGAALAAWEAISSSVPGRQTGKGYVIFSLLVLVATLFIPFVFFYPMGQGYDVWGSFMGGIECAQHVVLVGVLPWVFLGWKLSRNASFHPGWTGAWSGVSAFLLGTVTVQMHCPNWDARHMLSAHILPTFLLIFFTTFAGAYWFSRWRR